MSNESRERLTKRLIDDNALVQEAMRVEPEIGRIIEEVKAMKNMPGYNRVVTRSRLKQRLQPLVGWYAGEQDEMIPSGNEGYQHISAAVQQDKIRLHRMLASGSSHPLRTQEHWLAIMCILDQLLPPDAEDLRTE